MEGEKVSCKNCFSACCREGIYAGFTREEAAFIERGGTTLDLMSGGRRIRQYQFRTDCGHLGVDAETGRPTCVQHDNPERPTACKSFSAGSEECLFFRDLHGVDHKNKLLVERAGKE